MLSMRVECAMGVHVVHNWRVEISCKLSKSFIFRVFRGAIVFSMFDLVEMLL